MAKVHVRKNDKVRVISGKDTGTEGKVLRAFPQDGKVIVEGVNKVTKHIRPKSAQQPGGRIEQEAAIYASKVMLVCPKCNKATRIGHKILDSGEKVRVCKKCGEEFDA